MEISLYVIQGSVISTLIYYADNHLNAKTFLNSNKPKENKANALKKVSVALQQNAQIILKVISYDHT